MTDRSAHHVGRVAETHFLLRLQLHHALKNFVINPEVRHLTGGHNTLFDYWHATLGDRFFDMATMVHLGTAVEQGLRDYYMARKGHPTLVELRNDPRYKKGIFQRVQSWHGEGGVICLYRDEMGYDLNTNPHMRSTQELMAHRHLYAHNSGLLDEEYIENIEKITGEDIRKRPKLAESPYPAEDLYWFEPLDRIGDFIKEARSFFRLLP